MTLHVVDTDTGEVVDRQVMPDLDTETRAALRDSISMLGVLYPIIVDQNGEIIDGHNRWAIADELNIDCPKIIRHVTDESVMDASGYEAELETRSDFGCVEHAEAPPP